ncbi:LysR family transcriptional regulator [Citrobacter rodentium]|uniref:LysR-family transcriptional regulator n=2 Tax=Citrobacter rodentium TaxID=67825 RepID=D2THG8_CITRI|nr:LysR family transcriptional regulator [Citrobacter rodentium]KIQ49346.1 nodulation protein NfeD [Citrobacter rodentium]QBY27997.1 LysR family transcriptional regulator [Citrobacter rodentium]UHO30121.1 LysR family transcriptional regulator [Citrobacter rodentium NBRC 105723 = DSM 16636]CBG88162.1 LysR-family transcriptional regulator [Citrobacter rodentium ICC168]HAT8014509.1 LysR family transcriptional regulator [Citrobacter rodentium NBRC 105723 = DSM 16636]
MRYQHLDLNLLVALDVLLDEQNITRAAGRLHMTQSATSGVLNRLRTYFEDDLLTQVGRKMLPTPLARELHPSVQEVLLKIQTSIARRPIDEPATSKRHFRIMASDYVINIMLKDVLQVVHQEAPNITFAFLSPDHQSLGMLNRGELDMMIAPERFMPADQPSALLFEEQFVCMAWEENPEVGNTLTLDDWLRLGHVAVEFGRERQPGLEETLFAEFGLTRRLEVVANSYHSLPLLLMGTSRIATMHRRLAAQYARYLPLRIFPVPVDLPVMREFVSWHRSLDRDPIFNWLKDKIIAGAI